MVVLFNQEETVIYFISSCCAIHITNRANVPILLVLHPKASTHVHTHTYIVSTQIKQIGKPWSTHPIVVQNFNTREYINEIYNRLPIILYCTALRTRAHMYCIHTSTQHIKSFRSQNYVWRGKELERNKEREKITYHIIILNIYSKPQCRVE